jgi:hypothetical protein
MSSDYRELLAEFNAHKVEYLVVGAHALAAHGRSVRRRISTSGFACPRRTRRA